MSALAAALTLPLAACGAMHGGSSDASQTAAVAPAGVVSGTVDRSGTAGTAGTTVTTKSSGGSPATIGTSGSTGPAIPTAGQPKPAPPAAPSTAQAAANKKSIRGWVSCNGTSDDTAGAVRAFAAARQNAFTLVVDCPVRLHSGRAIDRGIFIDSGTTVEFSGTGKFIVDNVFHPAFVIANSSGIALTNWNVEWDGTVPIDPDFGGYELDDKFIASPGITQPAGAFNDLVLTKWLAVNRRVAFDETQGWVKSIWVGGVNPAAVFFITGDSSNIVFTGLKLYVPADAGGEHFMPMAVSFSPNWKSEQSVNGRTPHSAQFAAVPHGITFSGIDFDGTLMGWQGNVRDALFENVTSHRYGDVQDAKGGTTGGNGKWFPPPHLFYLNYVYTGDAGLFNSNIHISNVVDEGPRVGVARDKGGADGMSGYALSLKLGCTDCSVDNYRSARPDGFMDVLPSEALSVTNVTATYDSTFLNNMYPAAIRFPGNGYSHITFENLLMKDTAESTVKGPIGNATSASNESITFANAQFTMNRWAGSELPSPTIAGMSNSVSLEFTMPGQAMKVAYLQKAGMTAILKASPISVQPGMSTVLTWTTKDAGTCAAHGAWIGTIATVGSKVVKVGAVGNNDFDLVCENSDTSSTTTLRVIGQ